MGYRPVKPYLQRITLLAAVMTILAFAIGTLARRTHNPNLFLAVKAITIAGMAAMAWIMWGWYQGRDERQRLYFMRTLALTGGLLLVEILVMTVAMPSLHLTVPIVLFTAFGTLLFSALAIEIRRDLLEERGPRVALRKIAVFTPLFAAPLLWWLLTLLFPLPPMTFRTGLGIFTGAALAVSLYVAFSNLTEQ